MKLHIRTLLRFPAMYALATKSYTIKSRSIQSAHTQDTPCGRRPLTVKKNEANRNNQNHQPSTDMRTFSVLSLPDEGRLLRRYNDPLRSSEVSRKCSDGTVINGYLIFRGAFWASHRARKIYSLKTRGNV